MSWVIKFKVGKCCENCAFHWPAVVTFNIKKKFKKGKFLLEHLIIRTNLVGHRELELSELHCIRYTITNSSLGMFKITVLHNCNVRKFWTKSQIGSPLLLNCLFIAVYFTTLFKNLILSHSAVKHYYIIHEKTLHSLSSLQLALG